MPGRGHERVLEAERVEPVAAGRTALRVGVDDQLGAAAQRALARRVHVADDHVRPEALVEHRVGAAVDRHDHRPHVAHVRPQRAQVALVAGAADDDEHRAVAQLGAQRRQLQPPGQQLALLDHALDGVAGERLERGADVGAQRLVPRRELRRVEHPPGGDEPPGAADLAVVQLDRVAVLKELEQVVVEGFDEVHAGLGEQQRAHVRIGAGGARLRVDHRRDARGYEVLAGHAVEVAVRDDRDVGTA